MDAVQAVQRGLIDPNQAWKLTLRQPEPMKFDTGREYVWRLETSKGTIRVRLQPKIAPAQVTNVVFFTNSQFYNDLVIGRVTPGFIAQGGGPLRDGAGGPWYKPEVASSKDERHDGPYLVGSVRHGDNLYGSQFYVTFAAAHELDGKYAIFGNVIEGQEVVDAIEGVGTAEGQPLETIRIISASLETKALEAGSGPRGEEVLAPTNVTATNTDVDKVLIKWDTSAKATEYRVIRSAGADGTGYASDWQPATSYVDHNASPGIQYYYRVQARNGASESEVSSPAAGHRPIPKPAAGRLPFEVY